MKILVSRQAGFCSGVKAAVMRLRRALKNYPGRQIKVLGELVHNQQVNQEFIDQGVKFINNVEEALPGDLMIIRAHGTPAATYKYLEENGIEYIDDTCHKVKKTQDRIHELEEEGWQVAVFGEENHPETIALVGHTSDGFVVNKKLIDHISPSRKLAVICQSTANRQEFREVSEALQTMVDELQILPTFCDFTLEAQNDARDICAQSDVMLVIGGINSSNTKRLYEICSEIIPSFHIQTADQIQRVWIKGKEVVGITAGASTPKHVIDNVVKYLEDFRDTVEDIL